MPGPGSKPWAKDENGRIIQGKSALKRAHVRSRDRVKADDTPPVFKDDSKKDKKKGDKE